MRKVVKNPYRNCQAVDPTTCRYHGNQFARIEELKSNISEFFMRIEEDVPANKVITVHEPETDFLKFWDTCEKMLENESIETRRALYSYADDYGSRSLTLLLNNPDSKFIDWEENWEKIKLIDSFLTRNTPERSEPHTVYRGVDKFGYEVSELKPGVTVSFKSFLSTSSEIDVAKDFTPKDTPIILCLKTKEGVPIRMNFSEFEYLLPRDLKFKVVSIEENVSIENSRKPMKGITLITLSDI